MESLGVEKKLYKLTYSNYLTYNKTKWGINITHNASGIGDMCTNGWIHAYENPYLAVITDPIHGDFGEDSIMWESIGIVGITDGLKVGCTKLTTIKIIEKPIIENEKRMEFAIRCTLKLYTKDSCYGKWAYNWLNNIDRSGAAAKIVASTYHYDGVAYYIARAAYRNAMDNSIIIINTIARAISYIVRMNIGEIDFIEIVNDCGLN